MKRFVLILLVFSLCGFSIHANASESEIPLDSGIYVATCNSTSRSTTILTAGWQKGMYVVKVTLGNKSWNEKIVNK